MEGFSDKRPSKGQGTNMREGGGRGREGGKEGGLTQVNLLEVGGASLQIEGIQVVLLPHRVRLEDDGRAVGMDAVRHLGGREGGREGGRAG